MFSVPERAGPELRCVLDARLVEVIDWSSLHLESEQFVDSDLTAGYADVLYSVKVRGRETYLHLLFEHESHHKPWSLLQALGYQVRLWEKVASQPIEQNNKQLPPILTIILHHGDGGWRASTRFRDYFKLDEDLLQLFRPFLVDFGVVVDDIARVDVEAILLRPVPFPVRLTLLCFRFVREPSRLLSELLELRDEVREFYRLPEGAACLQAIFVYLGRGAKVPEAELNMAVVQLTGDAEIDEILYPGLQKKLWQAKEKRLEEKLRKAERKAEEAERKAAEARREVERKAEEARREVERDAERKAEEARRDAEKNLLLQLLGRRFGTLSPEAIAHVQAAGSSDVEAMTLRILTAQSVDEVLYGVNEKHH